MAKLDFSQEKVLEITKPDGSELRIRPRRIPFDQSNAHNERIKKLMVAYEADKIQAKDYILKSMELAVLDFNPDDYAEFTSEEMTVIFEHLVKLRDVRTEEEKKIP